MRSPPPVPVREERPGTVAEDITGLALEVEHDVPTGRRRPRLLISYLVTVFVLITLNFFLPRAMPGDPISALVDPAAPTFVQDEALREELLEYYGLDRPLLVQYGAYLGDLARGELGVSIRYNVPVAELVAERLPWTILLMATALVLAGAIGLIAGVHSAWRRGRVVDRGLLVTFWGLHNLPDFFLASLAVLFFSVKLGWFPLAGSRTPFANWSNPLQQVADIAHHLVLPASVAATGFAAAYYLVMRASMIGELGSDYLLLGRAKGLRERRLKYRYAARNALLPVVTLTALRLGFILVTADIFIETVFAYGGMGRLVFDSIAFRDYPTIQACFLMLSLLIVTANFLADVLYGRLDPRAAG